MTEIVHAHIGQTDLNTIGGAQESIKNLFMFHDPQGTGDPNWISISPYTPPEDILLSGHLETKSHYSVPFSGHMFPSSSEIVTARNYLTERNPTTILLNHPTLYTSAIFLSLPKHLRDRTNAIWRGVVGRDVYPIEGKSVLGKFARKGMRIGMERLQRHVGNHVQMNLAISEAAAESLLNIGIQEEKIKVIPEQIGGEYTPELRTRYGENFRRKFLDQDELGVLVVSRIAPYKGMEWVMELYEQLKQEVGYVHPDALIRRIRISVAGYALAGYQDYYQSLQKQAEEIEAHTSVHNAADRVRLEFLGRKNHSGLEQLYNAYDILCMPSPVEGFGRVTVEAMSAGMTVIGRGGCSATEHIIHEPPYAVGDIAETPNAASSQILSLMQEPVTLVELQSNAAQWATNHYSLDRAESEFWKAIGR